MGDALRVQTKFATAADLLNVVGGALERGSLRLPLHLKFTTPFEVALVAADGAEAVRGTAEVVEHAGHATWIRFLSAAPEQGGDDSARCMLADVDVDITGPQAAVVEPVASSSSEAFEAITAVNNRPPLAALGIADPVPLLPPPPELTPVPAVIEQERSIVPGAPESSALKGIEPVVVPDAADLVGASMGVVPEPAAGSISDAVRSVEAVPAEAPTRSSETMTAPIPVQTMAEVVESKGAAVEAKGATIESKDAAIAAGEISAPHGDINATGATSAIVTEDAEPIYVNEARDTEASPPVRVDANEAIALSEQVAKHVLDESEQQAKAALGHTGERHVTDAIARERGIEPIAEPYVRDSMPVVPEAAPRLRRVVVASVSFAAVCLVVAGIAIVWAQDAVAQAETKPAPRSPAPTAMVVDEPVAAAELVADKPVVEQPVQAREAPTREADTMVAMPVAATATCKLEIDASAADARVKIDGKDRGLAPATATVPCGTPVDIEVHHPRYAAYATTLTVTGEHQALRAKLERDKTTVTLRSDPPAAVTLNGVNIGKTPMTTTVSRFEQSTFRFSAPGFETDWRRIMPKSGTSAVVLALKRQR